MIQALVEEMLKQLTSYRNIAIASKVNSLQQQEELPSDTIQMAKSMACSILNLSHDDLDEIMQSATTLQECNKVSQ